MGKNLMLKGLKLRWSREFDEMVGNVNLVN